MITLNKKMHEDGKRKSIFRSIFVPLFMIMFLQAIIFYFAAVYGGMEESLNQNAADILSERLNNRKNEIETQFNDRWANLSDCEREIDRIYRQLERQAGDYPFVGNAKTQIGFLNETVSLLIDTLRRNEVNGVFLILNDQDSRQAFKREQKYGLCIRDMDQESGYSERDDLLLERAPSSMIGSIGCSLDSWWEPKYTFTSETDNAFYYEPLWAAWENPGVESENLAYCAGAHQISRADPAMISFSIPLMADDGYPYAVLGIELSVRYLASLLPSKELNEPDKSCYVLAFKTPGTTDYVPIVGTGSLYSRCFDANAVLSAADADRGGFRLTGRGDVELYGDFAPFMIYDNNNPFEERELTLLAMVESATLFSYIERVKVTLLTVALICLVIGLISITYVSRHFAAPITALAKRVRGMNKNSDFELGRLGIAEIDLLVDAIEDLNRNVSKNSARTEFFSRMSHDMRTPMNAIISFSSPELLEGVDEAVKDDYLSKIHSSGEFLLSLINEVLDMTKIESDKTELHPENAQACRLFETVVPIIEKLAQKKGVSFTQNISIHSDAYVAVDRQHLNQITMNLLSNAVKFTPSGGFVSLSADMTSEDGSPDRALCRIVVSDSGIGMSDAFIKNLYTPFEQEDGKHEGTGLGLSIAKKLVDLMDGDIECVSRQNEGTTFTVTLPLPTCEKPAIEEAEVYRPAEGQKSGVLRGKRLLICEDNAINTLIICKLLEKQGIDTVTANDGQEGVALFSASVPGHVRCRADGHQNACDGWACRRAHHSRHE